MKSAFNTNGVWKYFIYSTDDRFKIDLYKFLVTRKNNNSSAVNKDMSFILMFF